jgi:hypothetical protein
MLLFLIALLACQVYAGDLALPGGKLTYPVDLSTICQGSANAAVRRTGFLEATGIPVIGALQSNVNTTFYCNAQGTSYTTFDVDFTAALGLTVLGKEMPFAPANISYRGADTRLTASLVYGTVTLNIAMTLTPSKIYSFDFQMAPETEFTDPQQFPFGDIFGAATAGNSQTASDVVGLIQGGTVNGGFISYMYPDSLSFGVASGALLPGFTAGLEAYMRLATPADNGSALTGHFTGSSFQLLNASLFLIADKVGDVEPASFAFQMTDVGGVCSENTEIKAAVTIPANADWGLEAAINTRGSVKIYCSEAATKAPVKRNVQGAYVPQTIEGFKVSVEVDEFKVNFFDGEPVSASGKLDFDTKYGSWALDATIGSTKVIMSQELSASLPVNASAPTNATESAVATPPLYDVKFEFSADGPLSFGDFPFADKFLSDGLDTLTVSNVVASFYRVNVPGEVEYSVNRTFLVGAMANWTSGTSESLVNLAVKVNGNKLDAPNAQWSGRAEISVQVAIGDTVELSADLDIAKQASAEGGNVEIAAAIAGTIKNLEGLNATVISVAGILKAIIPAANLTDNKNLDVNKTMYAVDLGISEPVALEVFGSATARINDARVEYNNTDGVMKMTGSLSAGKDEGGVKFDVATEFNTKKSNTSRALTFLMIAAEAGDKGLDFASLPMADGLTGSFSSSGADSLVPVNKDSGFKGAFKFLFTSESDDVVITDHMHLNTSISTPWLSGALRLEMRRTLPAVAALGTNGSIAWSLERAKVDLSTEFANVTIDMNGSPCDPLTVVEFAGQGEFPVISQVNLAGTVKFGCVVNALNKTVIQKVDVAATAEVTIDIFDTQWTTDATITYSKDGNKSALWTFNVTTTGQAGGILNLQGVWNNATNYTVSIAAQNLAVADFPFWPKFEAEMPDLAKLAGSVTIKGANVNYAVVPGKPSLLDIAVTVAVDGQDFDFDTSIDASFVKGASWNATSLNTRSSLYVPDVDAAIEFSTSATCGQVGGQVTGTFTGKFANLPLGLPSDYRGDLFVPCDGVNAVYKNFTLSVPIGDINIGTALGLGEAFNLKNVVMNYSKPLSKFSAKTTLNTLVPITLNLEMGYGVRSPVGASVTNAAQSPLGVRVWGTLGNGTPMTLSELVTAAQGMVIDTVQNPMTVAARMRRRGDARTAEQDGFMDVLNKISFANPIFDVDPSTMDVNIRADIVIYGVKCKVIFQLAKDQFNSRVFAFGFAMKVPTDPALRSEMPDWLLQLIQFDGFEIEAMFVGVSTGAFSLTLPDDDGSKVPSFNCTSGSQQCLTQYSRNMAASVPTSINFKNGGFGVYGKIKFVDNKSSRDLYEKTGAFGDSLKSATGSLAFGLTLSMDSVSLSVGFDMTSTISQESGKECTAGTKQSRMIARHANGLIKREEYPCAAGTEYSGLSLVATLTRTTWKFSLGIVFEVDQQLKNDKIKFVGGVGIELSGVGLALNGFFDYTGVWKDPLGLSTAITVRKSSLDLSLSIPALVPTKFALSFGGGIESRHGNLDLKGCIKVDLAGLGTGGNGLYVNATNISLVPIVYGLAPSMPDSIMWIFQGIEIKSVLLSVNPSMNNIVMERCDNQVIEPGVLIDVTDFTLLKFFTVKRGYFELSTSLRSPGLKTNLELAPMGKKGWFYLASFESDELGPRASFNVTSTRTALAFSASLTVLGLRAAAMVDASVDLVSQQVAFDIQTSLGLWDIVTVATQIKGTGVSWDTMDLYLKFGVYMSDGPSLVARAMSAFFNDISNSLTSWKKKLDAERAAADKAAEDVKNEKERVKKQEEQRLKDLLSEANRELQQQNELCVYYQGKEDYWDDYCGWSSCAEEDKWTNMRKACWNEWSRLRNYRDSVQTKLDDLEPSWWERAWQTAVDAWNSVVDFSKQLLSLAAGFLATILKSIGDSFVESASNYLIIESIVVDGKLSELDMNAALTLRINKGPKEEYKGLISFNWIRMLQIIWGYIKGPVTEFLVTTLRNIGAREFATDVQNLLNPGESSLVLFKCTFTEMYSCKQWLNQSTNIDMDGLTMLNNYIFSFGTNTNVMYRCSISEPDKCEVWNTVPDSGAITTMVSFDSYLYIGTANKWMWRCDPNAKNACKKWNDAGNKRYRAMLVQGDYLWVAIDRILWRCGKLENNCATFEERGSEILSLAYSSNNRIIISLSSAWIMHCSPTDANEACVNMNEAGSQMPTIATTAGRLYARWENSNDIWACPDNQNHACGDWSTQYNFNGNVAYMQIVRGWLMIGTDRGVLYKCNGSLKTCSILGQWYSKCVTGVVNENINGNWETFVSLRDC